MACRALFAVRRDNEVELRFRAWIEERRQLVDKATGGKVGYIYVQSTGVDAQNELMRQFMAQWRKDGLIIDEPYTKKLKAEFPCWCGSGSCRGTLLAPKEDKDEKSKKKDKKAGKKNEKSEKGEKSEKKLSRKAAEARKESKKAKAAKGEKSAKTGKR